jgi:hypothetical protein
MTFYLKLASILVGSMAALAIASIYGASYYDTTEHGRGCASCHEMAEYVKAVHASGHRNQNCLDCHDASTATKLRHIRVHLTGNWSEEIRLRDVDVVRMTAKCQNCHQHEYASWQAGPHSATYSEIFTNPAHNGKRALMNDCFRCHGMHYNGSVSDLVQPQGTKGPWHLVRAGFADQPTIPCQSCHWVHRATAAQTKPHGRISVAPAPGQDSLAFFDRRESMHFATLSLALPQLHDGPRLVKLSPDPRQGLCYQCHAPREPETGTRAVTMGWGPQVGSGDDRTPIGVHEGISCISCHNGHNENARASCKTCHPQMSHCGLDVEKMDTTFVSASSTHNVHWVKCVDCHEHGIPQMKPPNR